jgi:hypothetical protein
MQRENAQAQKRKAESTDASVRGGPLRGSDEAAVMAVERRGWAVQFSLGQPAMGGTLTLGRKATVFQGLHEPDDARASRPDLWEAGGACVKKTSNRHAVRKMKVGPSEPPCRRRLQTAISCCGPKTAVVNVMVKRRGARSRHVWIREMSANDPLMKHRKPQRRHPKPGLAPRPGTSMKGTYLLAMRGSGV